VLPLAPLFPGYLLGLLTRGRVKELFATRLLKGAEASAVDAEADAFWAGPGARLLRADGLAELERRRAAGARVVIVTACPEPVAAPLARRLGVDILGTRLAVADGRFTGRLDGPNCRGPEKVARLEAAYGPGLRLIAAYGDSAGDRELLARAEEPRLRVFRDGPRFSLAATVALWV
jgi:phosphatidylglycerophosphatase C